MEVSKKLADGVLTLSVSGRLDTNTSPELEAEVRLEGVKEVVFDFAELEYISSAGLRVLLGAQKSMSASGGKLKILSPNQVVRDVLDITGCSPIFEIEPAS